MKKIIISILLVTMLLSVFSIAGCNKDTDGSDADATTTTTALVSPTLARPQGAAMYEFSKYGYHIYYPQGFTINEYEEGSNMVEFVRNPGIDFTILVLDNRYESVEDMMNNELMDGDEVVKSGSNYFLVYSAGNGRTSYTYYYFGEHKVTCELSYPDSQKEAMKGLEEQIMVELHSHAH